MTITTAMVKELRAATDAGILDCKKALESYGGDLNKAAEFLREKGLAKAAERADRETNAGLVVVKASGDSACAVEVNCETDFVAQTDRFKAFAHRIADQVLADPALTDTAALLAADFIDTPGKSTADVIQELIGILGENIVLHGVARYNGLIESYVHAGAVEGFYGPMEGRIGVLIQFGVSDNVDRRGLKDLARDLSLQIASAAPAYLAPKDVPDEIIEEIRLTTLQEHPSKPDAVKVKIVEGRIKKFYQDKCLLNQVFVKDDSLTVEALLQAKSQGLGGPVTVQRFTRFEVGHHDA